MKDHIKRVLWTLKTELPDCEIVLLRRKVHHVFELKRGDVSRRLVMAGTPKNTDHAILNAIKEAKKLMGVVP